MTTGEYYKSEWHTPRYKPHELTHSEWLSYLNDVWREDINTICFSTGKKDLLEVIPLGKLPLEFILK